MDILKPCYYDNFKCVAGECKDTCCRGWDINIDKTTFEKYQKVKGDFGKIITENILVRNNPSTLNYGKMNLKNNMCGFLNNESLCNVYIKLGEDFMCDTCKLYPREMYRYNDVYERGLSLSCPEVARLIVNLHDSITFNLEDGKLSKLDTTYVENRKHDSSLYNVLWEVRSLFIEIAQYREIPLWKRLIFIKFAEEKFQNILLNKTYTKINELTSNIISAIESENDTNSLDSINARNEIKTYLAYNVIKAKKNNGTTNETFNLFTENFHKLLELIESDKNYDKLQPIENDFNKYFENREYILENYIVHNLYNNCMKAINNQDINKEILVLIVNYTTIRMLLIAKWSSNEKILEPEDIIDVLYSYSREFDHNDKFKDFIYEEMKSNKNDTLAYLTALVR